jgi:hypothetical protein
MPPPGYAAPPSEQPLVGQAPAPAPAATRSRGKLIAGAAALLIVAGLAFLLLGSGGPQLGGPVAEAATLSSKTPGYRIHMAMEMTSSELSSPITASGGGIVDLRDNSASMSLAMDVGSQPQLTQQLGSSTFQMEMITEGGAVYVKLPDAVAAALPTSGRQWLKADLAKLSSIPGLSSLTGNPTASDPSSVLHSLRSVSDGIVDEGSQRIGGVQTTHYHADLNASALTGNLPSAERSVFRQALPPGGIPVDVWIDSSHLVRRVVMTLDLGIPGGPSVHQIVTVDLGHYGPQRAPVVPPADQVTDLTSLAQAAG